MSFEDVYLAERRHRELEADRLVDALKPLAPRRTPLELSYELMDAAIFHILQPPDAETRSRLTKSAFRALLLNRNLDHVPAFAGQLCHYLDVNDPAEVMNQALDGRTFLFAGFHTGPYWSIFQTLVEKGLHVSTLFPGTLESKRQEVVDVFTAVATHFDSPSTLDLISLDDPNFLLRLRSSTEAGRQLVVFLDGNSGAPAQRNEKRDVELGFFHSKVTVKTTILRLADILGLPLVTFNAVRQNIRRTLFLDEPLRNSKKRGYDELAQLVFGRLFSRLEEEPAQWEGWLYFHHYFSPAYRSSLECGNGPGSLEKSSRYFIQQRNEENAVLIDKQTYKQYRVNQREGARA